MATTPKLNYYEDLCSDKILAGQDKETFMQKNFPHHGIYSLHWRYLYHLPLAKIKRETYNR